MLVDATFRGRPRKLLLHADRNGFFYVLDRLNGELLLAEPFVKGITWARGIGKDGRRFSCLATSLRPKRRRRTCPSVAGATNWPSTAFSPTTGLFLMTEESCSIHSKSADWWVRGQSLRRGDAPLPG